MPVPAVEGWRRRLQSRRSQERILMARRLSGIAPETTLAAAFDLTEFALELSQVAG